MNKKKIIAMSLILTSLACTRTDEVTTARYVIGNSMSEDVVYSKGRVYIGDQNYLDSLKDITDKDILVLDDRKASDPDLKIYDSCKIVDAGEIDEILNLLLQYENDHPTGWDRTLDSMRREWIYHNLSYYLKYEIGRTRDVDLNNKDENKYAKTLLK